MLGGYPVGAKLLSGKVKADPSYKSRGEGMLMYCYCGSPVFLAALTDLGLYVWLSNVIACLIFALIANAARNVRGTPKKVQKNTPPPLRPAILVDAVTSTGIVLYKICLMVIVFGIITRLLTLAGITEPRLFALIEITNLIQLRASPALTAALTSLGGFCIMLQVSAICGGEMNLRRFAAARIPVAALSAGICWLFTRNAAVEAITKPRIEASAGGSVVASACLMIMTLILISTKITGDNQPD
jgi:hypothetical protein